MTAAGNSELVKELYRIDPAFKELMDEKNEGWKSREVNATWKERRVLGFHHVDWRKYQKEYQTILSPHIQLFKTGNRRFLDVGCAPGGLCSMLVNLGWHGLGVSLPESLGGLQMQYCNREKLIYREMDATANDAAASLSAWLDEQQAHELDFVNMGVVVSYTQSVLHSMAAAEGEHEQQACIFRGQSYLTAYRNVMLPALERLKPGGMLMWITQESSIETALRLIDLLDQLFEQVHLVLATSTSRSPFYLLCCGFRRNSKFANDTLQVLRSQSSPLSVEDCLFWRYESMDEADAVYRKFQKQLQQLWKTRSGSLKQFRESSEAGRSDQRDLSFNLPR